MSVRVSKMNQKQTENVAGSEQNHNTTNESYPGCPVQSEGGCPFKQVPMNLERIKCCPAFQDGCAFKQVRTAADLYGLVKDMPHLKSVKGSAKPELIGGDKDFFEMMTAIHKSSTIVEARNKAVDCPVLTAQDFPLNPDKLEHSMHFLLDLRQWTESFKLDTTASDESKVESKEVDATKPARQPLERKFSERIKEGTSESHKAAENVHFVKEFIRGKITAELYRQLVCDLYHVYNTLESQLEAHKDHKYIKPIHFPGKLNRTESLAQDMEYWWGENWKDMPETIPTPCTQEYVSRLKSTSPGGLVAHAYTRYMGDLSGGRVLMTKARKALQLKNNKGLAFYLFREIPSPSAFKNAYRAALDGLPLESQDEADKIVTEANIAFLLNMRLFSELDLMAGIIDNLTPLEVTIKSLRVHSTEPKISKCPFAKMNTLISNPEHSERRKSGYLGSSQAYYAAFAIIIAFLGFAVAFAFAEG